MQHKQCYLDIYLRDVVPGLQATDLLIKTSGDSIPKGAAARVLGLTVEEIGLIMTHCHLRELTPRSLPVVMSCGSSPLCRLLARQLRLGIWDAYTPEGIAYIYALDTGAVREAFRRLNLTVADSSRLRDIFSLIFI